ncbi:hypothetical protein [Bacillus kexueae]|uniref:hypothetical protein n=1 Tax=Aeribacillus kexueae TaxID=2078952 RepID=UPI001FAFC4C7|nr:hypothetical protein [Bacillus kexueae]
MSRGKSFQHKKKGHTPTPPKHGFDAAPKHNEEVTYDINTVASEEARPVTTRTTHE